MPPKKRNTSGLKDAIAAYNKVHKSDVDKRKKEEKQALAHLKPKMGKKPAAAKKGKGGRGGGRRRY